MTAKQKTTVATTTVAIINRGVGAIEVHKPNCRDIQRDAEGASIWKADVTSFKDVVLNVYADMEDVTEDNWADNAGDIIVMPCCPSLDGRQTRRNATWAQQYRARKRFEREALAEQYPVLITMS